MGSFLKERTTHIFIDVSEGPGAALEQPNDQPEDKVRVVTLSAYHRQGLLQLPYVELRQIKWLPEE